MPMVDFKKMFIYLILPVKHKSELATDIRGLCLHVNVLSKKHK